MSYHHFSAMERGKIEGMSRLGRSAREIGERIGRHHGSVSRELKRCAPSGSYTAEAAQSDYEEKRRRSRSAGKWSEERSGIIADRLRATWSPEQIAHTVLLGEVSFKTIYRWLYTGRLPGITVEQLRRKGKRRTSPTLAFYARGTPICKRPKEVHGRKTFGHWELDTVVSSPGGDRGCLATFIERKTRLYVALKIPDRTAASMEQAITYLHAALPQGTFQTATTDRGGEFACFEHIQHTLGLTLYFADPYCPHQRGSNEYANGLLREFFPKGTPLSTVSQQQLTNALILINSRPRKCLNWHTPIQLFLHELLLLAHFT